MSVVITEVAPVRLFGQTLPGIAAVRSGGYTLAFVAPKGGKRFETVTDSLTPGQRAKVSAMLGRVK